MSTQHDLLREVASRCRRSHHDALVVVGWFAATESEEALRDLLRFLDELPANQVPGGHFAAYNERWAARGSSPS